MRTTSLSRTLLALISITCLSLCAACSDDDPVNPGDGSGEPANTLWVEVDLPDDLPDGTLTGVAFYNNSSAAVGVGVDGNGILLENTSQGWRQVDVPQLSSATIYGVSIDQFGRRVLVGFRPDGTQLVLAEDTGWTEQLPSAMIAGGLLSVAVDEANMFLAVGAAVNQVAAWTGTASEVWSPVTIETPGDHNDKVMRDVAYGAGAWVACGFDDGGEGTLEQPYAILMIDEGTGWKLINTPCGGCGNYKFRSVAVSSTGGIWLGGAITDFSGGNEDYTAFLRTYSRDIEEWTEIVLPQASSLERVNDILIGANGDIYLACGVDSAALVRLPASGGTTNPDNIEWTSDHSRLRGLAQSNDGAVYAVGENNETSGVPMMLRRDP